MNSYGGSQRGGGAPPPNFGGGKSNYKKHYTGMIPESEEIGGNSDEHSNPSEGSGDTKGKGKAAYDSAYRKKQHEPNREAQAVIKDIVLRSLRRHLHRYLGDIAIPVSYQTDPYANMGISRVMEGDTSGLLPISSAGGSTEQDPVEHAPGPSNPPQYTLEQELRYLEGQLEPQPVPPEQKYGLAGFVPSQAFSNVTNRNYKK
ncbi:hypothetical protein TWF569_008187 [Orbilia oligospora]|nr:hypothetical protein TWF706_007588 [Orbilia oligospora]KAF3120605.1 hypothetical protein TWF594_003701 [Orbilia oligospora]KAF3140875.1 hypothetical protein TWF569_008187 [Orbilia oligospora]